MRAGLALAFLMLCSPALAQQHPTTFLLPLLYQQYSSLTSAIGLSGIPTRATTALFCVETANVRWRDDGTPPTTSIGMPLNAGQCLQYYGALPSIRFIAVTGSPVLNVTYYE